MLNIRLGVIEWLSGDGPYRPSLWLRIPGGWCVIFFGWQKPSVIWLN